MFPIQLNGDTMKWTSKDLRSGRWNIHMELERWWKGLRLRACSTALMYAAIFLGLAGSLHCVGMCGPLTLIAPCQDNTKLACPTDMTFYHASRISVYAIMGAIIGSVGQLFSISRFQTWTAAFFWVLLVYGDWVTTCQWVATNCSTRWVLIGFVKLYNRYLSKTSRKNVAMLGFAQRPAALWPRIFCHGYGISRGNLWRVRCKWSSWLGHHALVIRLSIWITGSQSVLSFLKQRGLSPILFMLSGAFVIYKAVSIMVPRTSLLNAVTDPIMCH